MILQPTLGVRWSRVNRCRQLRIRHGDSGLRWVVWKQEFWVKFAEIKLKKPHIECSSVSHNDEQEAAAGLKWTWAAAADSMEHSLEYDN